MAEGRVARATPFDLVSGVAHDFKTPIAAVRGAVTALREGGPALDDETRGRLLGVIADAADQLGRLVEDLLVAGRLEAGRLPVEIESCDAFAVAESVVEAARAASRGRVSLRLGARAGLPRIAADPDRLRSVVAGLVDNAVRHSPSGGSVEVRLDEAGGRVRIAVADEGRGIPPEEHDAVFERFHQGAGGGEGSGLGLYLARELALAMGGDVAVESVPGRGSTFTVALPLAREGGATGPGRPGR